MVGVREGGPPAPPAALGALLSPWNQPTRGRQPQAVRLNRRIRAAVTLKRQLEVNMRGLLPA